MKSFFQLLLFLLTLCVFTPADAVAAPRQKEKLPKIQAYIEANRSKKNIFFTRAKVNKNTKVYYLFQFNEPAGNYYMKKDFEKIVKSLAEAHKKIHNKGAEIIMLVNHSPADEARIAKARRSSYAPIPTDIPRELRQLRIRYIVANSFENSVRKTFLQSTTRASVNSRYSSDTLHIIDAHGKLLGIIEYSDGQIILEEITEDDSKLTALLEEGFNTDDWEADAILASYKKFVTRIEEKEEKEKQLAEEAERKAKEEEERKAQEEEERKQAQEKEEEARKTRWKKVKKWN